MYDTIFVTSFISRVDFHRLFFIFIKPNLGLVMAGQEGRLLNNRLECRFSRDNDPSVKDPNDPELDKVFVLNGTKYNLLIAKGSYASGTYFLREAPCRKSTRFLLVRK